jgi:hypothetical protein
VYQRANGCFSMSDCTTGRDVGDQDSGLTCTTIQNLLGGTEKNHEKTSSGYTVPGPRLEPEARSRNDSQ